ncbi:MAG: hypothetical protein ACXVSF_06495 [Solirubrobacteraceae bacterium]
MPSKAERKLAWLPPYGTPASEWREWLTAALSPAPGHRIDRFLRHGRQRTDACEIVLVTPGGDRRSIELGEQRHLSSPNSLRATVIAATDGLLRPERLTQAELEDIWVALVALATVTAQQSEKGDTREWLEQTIDAATPLTGFTLTGAGRPDALAALLGRKFDYHAARHLLDARKDEPSPPRPTLLIDAQTGEQWMRVGDLGTYWRHVLGVGTISHSAIDGRLSAIGVKRHEWAHKNASGSVRRVRLYRVGDREAPE